MRILAVGESMECTSSVVAAVAGQTTNTATVSGTGPDTVNPDGSTTPGETVSDDDPANYFGSEPSIGVVKSVNGDDANTAPGPFIGAGEPVTFTFVVTNDGNVRLTNIVLVDDVEGTISCPETALDAGASMTCSHAATAVEGVYENTGTVTGLGPNTVDENGVAVPGVEVTDNDPAHYFGAEPGIELVKRVQGDDAWRLVSRWSARRLWWLRLLVRRRTRRRCRVLVRTWLVLMVHRFRVRR